MHMICSTHPAYHLFLFPLYWMLVLSACHLLLVPLVYYDMLLIPLIYHRVLLPLVVHHTPQHGEESGRGNKAKDQGREGNTPAEFVEHS